MKRKQKSKIVERLTPVRGQEWLTEQHLSLYRLASPYVKGKRVLDAGCGCGLGSWTWLKDGALLVDAYDISAEAIDFARKNYSSNKITYNVADLEKTALPINKYDIVCAVEVIEHLRNYRFYLESIFKSLKKNGYLFLTTPNATVNGIQNEYHLNNINYNELASLMKKEKFQIVKFRSMSVNSFSKITPRIIPSAVRDMIKKTGVYPLVIKLLFRPKVSEAKMSDETVIVIAKRK